MAVCKDLSQLDDTETRKVKRWAMRWWMPRASPAAIDASG